MPPSFPRFACIDVSLVCGAAKNLNEFFDGHHQGALFWQHIRTIDHRLDPNQVFIFERPTNQCDA
jgi:hypothetical protein